MLRCVGEMQKQKCPLPFTAFESIRIGTFEHWQARQKKNAGVFRFV